MNSKKGKTANTPPEKPKGIVDNSGLALPNKDEQLEVFFKQSLDGFFFMDMISPIEWNDSVEKETVLKKFYHDQRVTKVNQAFLDQYGAKETDIIGFSPADFFKHNYNHGLEVCKKILDKGQTTVVTDERKIDGTQIWIEGNYFLFKNEKNQITGLFGIQRDITEKQRIEIELKNNEARYRSLFNSNPHHTFIYDLETLQFLSVNDSAIQFYGYTLDEFCSMTIKDISPKEEWARIDSIVGMVRKEGLPTFTKDWKHIKKDGSFFYVDIRARNIIHEGKSARIAVTTDITESRHLQEILKSSEESFKGLFNSINNAIYILDEKGLFIDVNRGSEKMYGYAKSEFVGKSPEFLSVPGLNDIEQVNKYLDSTFKGYGPSSFEFWGKRKDGMIFPKHVTVSKGTYFGHDVLIAVATDITERKSFEQSLAVSESNFKTVFRNIYDAILIHDSTGNVIEANERAVELYDVSYHQLTHSNIRELSADTANQMARIAEIWKTVTKSSNTTLEWKAKKPISGIIFDVEASFCKSTWTGKEVIIAIVRDITERKQIELYLRESEERFRRIYEDAPIGIFRTTPTGKVLIANPSLVKMLGYSSFEELSSLDIEKQIYSPDFSRNFFISELEKNGSVSGMEYSMLRKDGSMIYVRENARIVRDTFGNTLYYEGTIEDISERKNVEQNLISSEKKLRELNATKDKFFSIIAHDLRSPFQGLLGISSVLADEEDLDLQERIQYAKKLHDGLKTQFALLEDLLTWSRIQRGVIEFKPELNKPYDDINEILIPFNSAVEKKNLILNFICKENLTAVYDGNMFSTVVRNLVSNAIKFTTNNGTIIVKASLTENDLVISVSDSGIGITKDDLPKLFKIDSHFVRRGTHDEGGSGLGLVLCKEFVEKHGGKFWVESTVNVGSTFSFSIPKHK